MPTRFEKEARLQQRARAIWLYGLSGAGKTSLGTALEARLAAAGFTTALLDGDQVRSGLNHGLGFSDAERAENLRRAAEVAKLFIEAGVIPICAFITPLRANRELVRGIIGNADFLEIYLSASYDACARRDPKGLYRRVEKHQLQQFSGRDSVFEPPHANEASLVIDTASVPLTACVAQLESFVLPHLQLPVRG